LITGLWFRRRAPRAGRAVAPRVSSVVTSARKRIGLRVPFADRAAGPVRRSRSGKAAGPAHEQ
ncbi:MAG: hypothetical protein LC808_20120, partial [Actinobacteria bacterium]|nr:hypothetical protein [Actinomycetota bacterium]